MRSRDLPGTRSDLFVDSEVTEVAEGDGWIQLRTPSRSDYWDGNCAILDEAPAPPEAPAERWAEVLAAWFASRGCGRLRWECLDPRPPDATLPPGMTYERRTTLRLTRRVVLSGPPAGLSMRPARIEDFGALTELALAEVEPGGSLEAFMRWMYDKHARLVATGRATWWTAWDGDVAVGALGLVMGPELARFQDVETRASHRRRGVASNLIRLALEGAGAWSGGAPPIYIVADTDDVAVERLYRALGFEPVSWRHTVIRTE